MTQDELKDIIKNSYYRALCYDVVLNPSYDVFLSIANSLCNSYLAFLLLNYLEEYGSIDDVTFDDLINIDFLLKIAAKYDTSTVILLPSALLFLYGLRQSDFITVDAVALLRRILGIGFILYNVRFFNARQKPEKEVEEMISKPFLLLGATSKSHTEFCPFEIDLQLIK